MGSSIEGASVNKHGDLFAVNQTLFLNLADAHIPPLMTGNTSSSFGSSRFTRTLGILVGDATLHTVWKTSKAGAKQLPLFPPEPRMLQPNDMAISSDETRLYLSGMNYDADTGDLWYYDITNKVLHNINLPKQNGTAFRTNSIELSPDDTELFISSAENNADEVPIAAKLFRFQIDHKTGIPKNPRTGIDLYKTLIQKGLDPAGAGLDPDGMRVDVKGNLFISLNAFQGVLKWNIYCDPSTSEVIKLETVKFPTNLELAGVEGKDLYVVGQCSDGKTACIDHYRHDTVGKAFANLNCQI
jgi:sugar lactone lactonase YvrE